MLADRGRRHIEERGTERHPAARFDALDHPGTTVAGPCRLFHVDRELSLELSHELDGPSVHGRRRPLAGRVQAMRGPLGAGRGEGIEAPWRLAGIGQSLQFRPSHVAFQRAGIDRLIQTFRIAHYAPSALRILCERHPGAKPFAIDTATYPVAGLPSPAGGTSPSQRRSVAVPGPSRPSHARTRATGSADEPCSEPSEGLFTAPVSRAGGSEPQPAKPTDRTKRRRRTRNASRFIAQPPAGVETRS